MAELNSFFSKTIKRLQTSLNQVGQNFEMNRTKAYVWLMDKVERIKNPAGDENRTPLDYVIKYPGYFYMFRYDSKLYAEGKLKFFDAYPLVFVFQVDKDGFTGINFHYILPKFRALILVHLMKTYGDRFFKNERLIPVNWNMMQSSLGGAKRHINVAVKRYLWSNVQKMRGVSAMRIDNTDMENTMYFTSADWVNTTEHQIRQYIKKNTQ